MHTGELTYCYLSVTDTATAPPYIAPEELIARLIAALRAIMLALLDATLLPGPYRRRLHASITAYFAEFITQPTACLTTPRQPRAALRLAPARPTSSTPRQSPAPTRPRNPAAPAHPETAPATAFPKLRPITVAPNTTPRRVPPHYPATAFTPTALNPQKSAYTTADPHV